MFASISLTTFNRKKLSQFCIQTVYETTPAREYEFIVTDNGSTDGTVEMLKRYKAQGVIDKLVLDHYNNLGSSINDAWKISSPKATWLIVLSNDHFCMEGWFQNLKKVIQSSLRTDYILANLWMPAFKKRIPHLTPNGGSYVVKNDRWRMGHPYGGGLVIRRKTVKKHNLEFITGPSPFHSGSIYTFFCRNLHRLKMKGVELGKPCILTQDLEFANPEYEAYYKRVFTLPNRVRRGHSGMAKFNHYRKLGGLSLLPEEYYEGSGYQIGKHYQAALEAAKPVVAKKKAAAKAGVKKHSKKWLAAKAARRREALKTKAKRKEK